ncbi:MAG: fatty acid desaturase [Myxococcota bacterium]
MNSSTVEWPTFILAGVIYGLFGLLIANYAALPGWLTWPAGALLLTWHSSLQHETVHGHPFSRRALNTAIGAIPLSLWLPYEVYRRSHLAHHRSELTHPDEDPESFYVTRQHWRAASGGERAFRRAYHTFMGRLFFAPFVVVTTTTLRTLRELSGGDRLLRIHVAVHVVTVGIIAWIIARSAVPWSVYIGAWVLPSVSLTAMRSFTEHRALAEPESRSALVESNAFWSLLFLYNNLHEVHHRHPQLPWYKIPRRYRSCGADGELRFRGYLEIARRYAFTPHDAAEWPTEL